MELMEHPVRDITPTCVKSLIGQFRPDPVPYHAVIFSVRPQSDRKRQLWTPTTARLPRGDDYSFMQLSFHPWLLLFPPLLLLLVLCAV